MYSRALTISALLMCLCPVPAHAFVFHFSSGGAATGDHQQAMVDLINAFKQDYPDATVSYEVSTSYLRSITATLMQNFGDTTPDVAVVGLVEWPIIQKKGLLRRLDSVLNSKDLAKLWGALLPHARAQKYGSKVANRDFALPFNRGTPMLFVNQALLSEYKAKPPLTWNDFGGLLSRASEKSAERKSAIRLALPIDDWITEAILIGARGETTLTGRTSHIDDPAIKIAISALRRIRDQGGLYLAATQRQAYDDFIAGRAAVALISSSAYQSVASRVKFPLFVGMPPRLHVNAINTGGGDLVLPLNPLKTLDEKTKKDIRNFISWFYHGRGTALWTSYASMFVLTRSGAEHKLYKKWLRDRPDAAKVFRGPWAIKSFYDVDEFCNILKLRQLAVKTFEDALSAPDTSQLLSQSAEVAGTLLRNPECP